MALDGGDCGRCKWQPAQTTRTAFCNVPLRGGESKLPRHPVSFGLLVFHDYSRRIMESPNLLGGLGGLLLEGDAEVSRAQ